MSELPPAPWRATHWRSRRQRRLRDVQKIKPFKYSRKTRKIWSSKAARGNGSPIVGTSFWHNSHKWHENLILIRCLSTRAVVASHGRTSAAPPTRYKHSCNEIHADLPRRALIITSCRIANDRVLSLYRLQNPRRNIKSKKKKLIKKKLVSPRISKLNYLRSSPYI